VNTKQVIDIASQHLYEMPGHIFNVLELSKPISPDAAVDLSKVISKLSPLLGNMIEFNTCEFLNDKPDFQGWGKWKRQDPGFPDIVFDGVVHPTPGFEIKAWFPLATEITGRFKDSQNHFLDDRTYVALIAWLPEYVIYGKPRIIGVSIASGASVALARDTHYHNPPDYLVLEPEDTSKRTRNLQQTNTAGYKWQASPNSAVEVENLRAAARIVESWGAERKEYCPSAAYQQKLKMLTGQFNYRQDTNFAKLDRIGHAGIEDFARRIYALEYHGKTIGEWNSLLAGKDEAAIKAALSERFNIQDLDADKALFS